MLFLHIGRGKAGSSTIQHFMFHHQAFLREHGVHPVLDRRDHPRPLRIAQRFGRRGQAADGTLEAFRQDIGRAAVSVIASSEAFFDIDGEAIDDLREVIGEVPVRVLVYLRDYASWLPSTYMQHMKMERLFVGFDEYFVRKSNEASALPAIERWAGAFGWSSLSIRNLAGEDLVEGDLIHDLCAQLGVGAAAPPFRRINVALPWWILELARALYGAVDDYPEPARERIRGEITASLKGLGAWATIDGAPSCPTAQYATAAQLEDLSRRYQDDLATLRALTGCRLEHRPPESRERPFAPHIRHVPPELLHGAHRGLPAGVSPGLRELVARQVGL